MKRRLLYFFLALFVIALTGGILLGDTSDLPSFKNVRTAFVPSDAALLDHNGELLQELRVDPHTRRLKWVSIEDVPTHFVRALLYAEDHRFYQHHGVDWLALLGAAFHAPFVRNARGASTITMQVVARLDPGLKDTKSKKKGLSQKLRQIREAIALENTWSKKEVLEAYLNLTFFRGELQGLEAASQGLLQKSPNGLSLEESVILASMVQSPNAPETRIAQRACRIGTALKLITGCRQIEDTVRRVLAKPYMIPPKASLALHAARQLLKKGATFQTSTLDKALQTFALETLQRQLIALEGKNAHDGAVLVLDNQSGAVLSYVGNSGETVSLHVDGVRAERQAGSTLKPFLYAVSLEDRLLTPGSLINDSPVEIPVAGGVYRPKNYDDTFHGTVTVREALASSINVPAVKTLQLVGVDRFVDKLRQLGFANLRANDFYGPSLALGAADVTLWDLTNAYRSLAHAGMWSEPHLLSANQPTSGSRVFSEDVAFLIGNILSDRASRSLTFGLSSPLAGRSWFAVKTGTSKDMRDNWCVGYSDHYTVGVWVGNFSGEPMWDVSGVSGAAPVFAEIMAWLQNSEPSQAPKAPAGVVRTLGGKTDWVLRGTESRNPTKLAKPVPRIVYPASDTVFAWDPDIPPNLQRVIFEAQAYDPAWEWRLNDKSIGVASASRPWIPRQSGTYVLSLVDHKNRVLDKVSFQVRGGTSSDQ